jgi:hypothetical protein
VPFRPDGFLQVARQIQGSQIVPSGEPRYRTIAGRSYYAAYLATCDAISTTHRIPADSYFPHEVVSTRLAAYNADPDVKKLGNLLNTLRLTRIHADYTRHTELTEDQADDAVTDASAIMTLLATVGPRLPKIDPSDRSR